MKEVIRESNEPHLAKDVLTLLENENRHYQRRRRLRLWIIFSSIAVLALLIVLDSLGYKVSTLWVSLFNFGACMVGVISSRHRDAVAAAAAFRDKRLIAPLLQVAESKDARRGLAVLLPLLEPEDGPLLAEEDRKRLRKLLPGTPQALITYDITGNTEEPFVLAVLGAVGVLGDIQSIQDLECTATFADAHKGDSWRKIGQKAHSVLAELKFIAARSVISERLTDSTQDMAIQASDVQRQL